MIKWFPLLILPFLLAASSIKLDQFAKIHAPFNRRIGSVDYDVRPLVDWHHLSKAEQKHFPRPHALANWVYVRFGHSSIRTNGYFLAEQVGGGYVAVKNFPTNSPSVSVLYRLPSYVNLYYGATPVRAAAFDFGVPVTK